MTKVGQVGPNGYSWILRCLSPKYTNLTPWVNTTVSTHCHCVNFLVRNKQTRCSLAVLLETVWFIHWLIKLSLPSIPWWKYLQNIITPKPLELGTWSFGTIFIPPSLSGITYHISHVIWHHFSQTVRAGDLKLWDNAQHAPPCETAGLCVEPSLLQKGYPRPAGPVD